MGRPRVGRVFAQTTLLFALFASAAGAAPAARRAARTQWSRTTPPPRTHVIDGVRWAREILRPRASESTRGLPCNVTTSNDAQGALEHLGRVALFANGRGCDWQHPLLRTESAVVSSEPRREYVGSVAGIAPSSSFGEGAAAVTAAAGSSAIALVAHDLARRPRHRIAGIRVRPFFPSGGLGIAIGIATF